MIRLLLTLLVLIPAIHGYDVTLYVDNSRINTDGAYVTVASTTVIKCTAPYGFGQLKLSLLEVSDYIGDTRTLASTSYKSGQWDISVVLYGLTKSIQLRCELSDTFVKRAQSHTANIVPSPSLPLPNINYNTDRSISMGPGFTTSRPSSTTPAISFGSTYIIYILVIVIFLSFLASTGAVACWLSARVRANRMRAQRAHAARIREIQESMVSQSDTVVLTHLQVSSRQDAPPPYEGAPINTTISLHIDSAPPCYQEALTQPPMEVRTPPQPQGDAPPPFETPSEPIHTSTQSLEIPSEETDRLLPNSVD